MPKKEIRLGVIDEVEAVAAQAWRRTEMKQRESNVGTAERLMRVAGGGLLAAVSVVLLLGGVAWWSAALEVAGIALGIDFVYTGITGYCPLYSKLGWSTVRRSIPKGTG